MSSARQQAPQPLPTPGGPPPGLRAVAPSAAEVSASRAEALGAVLKLGSALCGLAAAVLFVLPLLRGELQTQPRLITLTPTFAPQKDPKAPVVASPGTQEESVPAARDGLRDPFVAPEPDPVVQEERADFDGAILVLESEPAGAVTWVDGKEQGETPVSVGLDCRPGTPVVVEFTLRGHQRLTHHTLCPKDAMLKLSARLRKSEKPEAAPAPSPGKKGSRKK